MIRAIPRLKCFKIISTIAVEDNFDHYDVFRGKKTIIICSYSELEEYGPFIALETYAIIICDKILVEYEGHYQ